MLCHLKCMLQTYEIHVKYCLNQPTFDARHIYPSLVLVQPRKIRPYITERLLMGRKESKQTKKKLLKFLLQIEIRSPSTFNKKNIN